MLVLTRKAGEKIKIGEDIVISVFEISKGSVKIGIEAPRKTPIYRHEVYERIQEENIRAAGGRIADIEEAISIVRKKGFKE